MVGAEHTGATQWDAGHALADYIERTAIGAANCSIDGCYASSKYANRTALELGAGAGGLVSIAMIRAGATVLATDGDEGVLEFLNLNIKGNTRAAPGQFLGAERLCWGDSDAIERVRKRLAPSMLDLIVMSDVVFHTIDTAALVEALATLAAADPSPEILVAHTWRFVREDEDFLDAVDAVFDRHTVPAEDLHPRFREGRGGDTSILRLVPRKRPP
jgi:predicted nicotinamide N-methyase